MSPSSENLQKLLFNKILEKLHAKGKGIEELVDLLQVGKSSVYKRISGEKIISLEELTDLARTYEISLDQLFSLNPEGLFIHLPAMDKANLNPLAFLKVVEQNNLLVHQLHNPSFKYISTDIPIFYYFNFPTLAAFKLYVYAKSIWQLDDYENQDFTADLFKSTEYLELYSRLYKGWGVLPSKEVWCSNLIDNTIRQLEYYIDCGFLEKQLVEDLIIPEFNELINMMERFAETGRKDIEEGVEGASFALYHNEITNTPNTIIVESDGLNRFYSTIDTPNFFYSEDKKLVDYSLNWFEQLKRVSNSISSESVKSRKSYFNKSRKKLKGLI